MATNLGRLISSTLVKSEFSNSTSRRLICSTTQLFTQQQEKKEPSVTEINEKTQEQIEDEQKFDSDDEEDKNKLTGEIGGPRGPEPTRYGDWEKNDLVGFKKTRLQFQNTRFLIKVSGSTEICSSSACSWGEAIVRFPFRLENRHPKQCGYPGFDLFCDSLNQTVLELPNSGKFSIQAIDYETQNIWINDPEYCLPKRLLTLNLSGSPFTGVFYQDFTLFNCTSDYRRYQLDPIACLSGKNYTVFASSDERAISFLASECNLIATVAVPVQWTFFEPVMSSDLGGDLVLRWAAPLCGRCESRGGRCRLKSNSSAEIECSNVSRRHGLPRGARYAITVGAGVPAILCLVGLLCCICGE
ncbi:putative RING-H2 finger protein [Forsythia ovata]|uniref:RING-type E3 ubiquitin transferase n=1 Tax=Forsythia ovata TaxID=205694 RepID=A0ABD1WM94_9LAMI